MQTDLSWNAAKIICEEQFSRSYKGKDTEFTEQKAKHNTDLRISKILSLNWKKFKIEYPIFDKLSNFAVYRLKVKCTI